MADLGCFLTLDRIAQPFAQRSHHHFRLGSPYAGPGSRHIGDIAIFLPWLANSTGWILTEVGRQPWIVQGLMRIEQGLSPNVGVVELLITLIGFTLLYGALAVADVYLLQKFARVSVTASHSDDNANAPDDNLYLASK